MQKFNQGDKVLVRNYNDTDLWLPGEIIEVTDPVSYKVRIGKIFRRHQDQLRKGCTVSKLSSQAELSTQDDYIFPSTVSNDNIEPSTPKTAPVRKSTRIRKLPDRTCTITSYICFLYFDFDLPQFF